MRTHLYLGIYEGRTTSFKNGITSIEESGGDRMISYSKGGNLLTVYAICTHLPGLNEKMKEFEIAGKDHFYHYRQKFHKDKTEYLMYEKAPKGLPVLTYQDILNWYKTESQYYSGFYWVKDDYISLDKPLRSDKHKISEFMDKVWKNPKKYLVNYQ